MTQTDVRKLLAVTQGKEKTYAGTSNDTEQGRAFLKKQLDGLMAEKAQYKEKKLALQQLKEQLPSLQESAEYHEPAGKRPMSWGVFSAICLRKQLFLPWDPVPLTAIGRLPTARARCWACLEPIARSPRAIRAWVRPSRSRRTEGS